MEISWKWSNCCFCLLFFQLCNGYPIDRGDTLTDQQTKLLTGIVSLLLTICGLVFLAGCLCCQRRNAFKEFRNSPVTASAPLELDHGHVNPLPNGEFTIFTPLSPPLLNNNIFLPSDHIVARSFDNQELNDLHLKSWFNESEKDFPRIKLKYIKEIGRGWFGKVVEGAAQDIDNKGSVWTPVVVRILEATSCQKEKTLFLKDATIYRCSSHENILSLVGRCLDSVPFLLLQEYCSQGDLKAYLRSNKSHPEQILSTEYPLLWCYQLTSALKHLHDNNITHPDLATRNCQLSSALTLKVGDYGLGVFKYPIDYYQGAAGVPVRWCAPESLTCTQTTIQPKGVNREGNVWSLGVTMWEICECAEQPYAALTDDEVVSRVMASPHLRLARPTFSAIYTDYIFRLMQLCWTNVESRPTVSQIHVMLADLLQVHQNTTSNPSHESLFLDDFDQRWASLKPNSLVKADDITVHFSDLRKTLSPSLNNLHGSLDNLLANESDSHGMFIEEDELKNGFSSTNDDSLTSEMICNSNSGEQRVSVKRKSKTKSKIESEDDCLSNSKLFQRTSSGSETEDDNWRNKVERGAYTEKVRQKSKSVADLMILTHVDYSESESETPLPSLDYKVNYKNVRLAPTNNLETASMTFASEGNLLSIQDTFQEELKKLQDERRDSLLFVPDSLSSENIKVANLIQELNSTVEIQPPNQVFNVFNVSIDSYSPLHVSKLDKIINFNESGMSSALDIENYRAGTSLNGDTQVIDIVESERNSSQESCQTGFLNSEVIDDGEKNLKDSLENITGECEEVYDEKITTEKSMCDAANSVKYPDNRFEHVAEIPEPVISISSTNLDLQNIASECEITGLKDHLDICETHNEVLVSKEVEKLSDLIHNNEDLKKYVESPSIENYDENSFDGAECVNFDLSSNQEGTMPNSLTHFSAFSSTPFKKKDLSLPVADTYSSINIFCNPEDTKEPQDMEDKDLNYSLETWDNFLGRTFDHQNIQNDNLFETFSSEPKSLMFVDNEDVEVEELCDSALNQNVIPNEIIENEDLQKNTHPIVLNEKTEGSISIEGGTGDEPNMTYVVDNASFQDSSPDDPNSGSWESGGGWFLHPQSNIDDLCGEMQLQTSSKSDSYVGFGIDDEIMSAIRNELISKLPHAQSGTVEKIRDDDDWDTCERNEVFLKYNVYNTPLSPIPEESYIEDSSGKNSPSRKYCENEDSDWSEHCEVGTLTQEIPTHSPQSPMRVTLNMHTPSQDSCCSNDTLFNLEELNFNALELEKDAELNAKILEDIDEAEIRNILNESESNNEKTFVVDPSGNVEQSNASRETEVIINEFLLEERNQASIGISQNITKCDVTKPNTLAVNMAFSTPHPVPLPSPEENPWKQLPASLVSIDRVASMSTSFSLENGQNADNNETGIENVPDCIENLKHHIIEDKFHCLNPQTTDLDEEFFSDSSLNEKEVRDSHGRETVETLSEVLHISDKPKDSENSKENDDHISVCDNMDRDKNIDPIICEPRSIDLDEINSLVLEDSPKNDEGDLKYELSHFELSEQSNQESRQRCQYKTPIIGIIEDDELNTSIGEDKNQDFELVSQYLNISGNGGNTVIIREGEGQIENSVYQKEPEYTNRAVENSAAIYENQKTISNEFENVDRLYENVTDEAKIAEKENYYKNSDIESVEELYENVNSEKLYDDYVNIVNIENARNSLDYDNPEKDGEYMNIYNQEEDLHSEVDNIFGVLTDIRFSGPSDSQLMSTSFSENNDDHDWDSGSDSRSSSSGEFIWKEGEHEESLKAHRAAPQDLMENVQPMEGIAEGDYEGSDISSSFSDDEGETPEFVPSAWDKFAIPSKSALRSPEKTLKKTDEKPKGVWFKKQKYHCIYEYPKELESPVLQSQDLWKPQSDFKTFADWEFDLEPSEPTSGDDQDISIISDRPELSGISNHTNLYQLTSISDFMNGENEKQAYSDEFFISGSAQPFHTHSQSSQFFPGSTMWASENVTPDSGVDLTPGSLSDAADYPKLTVALPTLKHLASEAVNKRKLALTKRKEVLGGLRHTRAKLKLDLPPSPSEKIFSLEPFVREKPTFSTFGKSRFQVQHVDTPHDDVEAKNVSFEALPYRASNQIVQKLDALILAPNQTGMDPTNTNIEVVKGEASLLDSGDEDSGIESSTLERRTKNIDA